MRRRLSNRALQRTARAITALALLGLALPTNALAYHQGIHLEVTPEVGSFTLGQPVVLTAILVNDEHFETQAATETRVDFENESGANDWDGTTRTSPDYSCVIPVGESTCAVELEASRTGIATFRGWFGTADQDETRFAGFEDCSQQRDTSSHCRTNEINGAPNPGSTCGLSASASTQLPGEEPDCTDVVQANFLENAAGTLDCDDSTGPDTEHETNPHAAASATGNPSIENYTCYARDELGNLKPGVDVFAEIVSGVNDPDGGARFSSADFPPCKTRSDDVTTPNVDEKGTCVIPIGQQNPPQSGLATICFWVGSVSEGLELCGSEPVSAAATPEGADQGDNRVDMTELSWENIDQFELDCSPETGFSLVNSVGTVDCEVRSSVSDQPVQDVLVIAEASGANDPDDSDSPQTQDSQPAVNGTNPEPNPLSCATGPNGRCFIKHRGADAGETTYRVWISDEVPEPDPNRQGIDQDLDDLTEGRDERVTPGASGEPDGTDVVISDWGKGPTSLVASPKSADAPTDRCHEITLTATDQDGNPAGGVRIDVEQQHERFRNSTPSDEPIIGFCTPIAGPNPSDVDIAAGDLKPSGTGPNTSGTAGGETVQHTDTNGQVTIGFITEPAQGSDGTGAVYITTWWEATDNDDPGGGDPGDSSLVRWVEASSNEAALDLTPDVAAQDPGSETTFTATVTRNGSPLEGVQLAWSSTGAGTFTWNEPVTDADGQAIAIVTSSELGSMTVTAQCQGAYTCSDTSTQNWGPVLCDVVGSEGPDVLTGSDASETICGFGGDDVIDGGAGDDVIFGDAGDDSLKGGPGNDELRGSTGDDVLDGGEGVDELLGEIGNDRIKGGSAPDLLLGASGNDALRGGAGADKLVGGRGRDSLDGQRGRDECYEASTRTRPTRC